MASVKINFKGREFVIVGNNADELDHFMHMVWYAAFEGANMAAHDKRYATEEDHKQLAEACSAVWL